MLIICDIYEETGLSGVILVSLCLYYPSTSVIMNIYSPNAYVYYVQGCQRLIHLHLFTECFMKITPESSQQTQNIFLTFSLRYI